MSLAAIPLANVAIPSLQAGWWDAEAVAEIERQHQQRCTPDAACQPAACRQGDAGREYGEIARLLHPSGELDILEQRPLRETIYSVEHGAADKDCLVSGRISERP